MERIVIERNSSLVYVAIVLAAFLLTVVVIVLMFAELNMFYIINLFFIVPMAFFILIYTYFASRAKNKEMIVIDDTGLTINGGVMLGPIPWDCISDAKVFRVLLEKHMTVSIVNIIKLQNLLGEETVHKKIQTDRTTGDKMIQVDLDLCKLRGIDIESLIKERAAGRGTISASATWNKEGGRKKWKITKR